MRLYSVDDEGNHGVVFRSLEASRLVTALAARWGYRLPYAWASMSVRQRGDHWWWRSERRHPRGGGSLTLEARVGEPVEPTDLEVFLIARWGCTPTRPVAPGGRPTSTRRGPYTRPRCFTWTRTSSTAQDSTRERSRCCARSSHLASTPPSACRAPCDGPSLFHGVLGSRHRARFLQISRAVTGCRSLAALSGLPWVTR